MQIEEAELVFTSLADAARALTPRRLELFRLIRRGSFSFRLAELPSNRICLIPSEGIAPVLF